MAHRPLRLALAAFLFCCACDVEPKNFGSDPDAGRRSDSGTGDAGGPSCANGGVVCKAEEYCDDAERCVARPTGCASHDDCRGGERCLVPPIGTSTKTPGRCGADLFSCDTDDDCFSDQRCTDLFRCAPRVTSISILGATPVFDVPCANARECGPGGVCSNGFCALCTKNSDCPGSLSCNDGACTEPDRCLVGGDCFPGSSCVAGACVRPTAGCTRDLLNDDPTGATALFEARFEGLTLCGDDTDIYTLHQGADSGFTIVITSTASLGTIEAIVFDDVFDEPLGLQQLSLPGFLALRAPVTGAAKSWYLGIRSPDGSLPYTIDLWHTAGQCAGDALDMYGDDTTLRALSSPVNRPLLRRHCAGGQDLVAFDLAADDTVLFDALLARTGDDLALELLDPAGQILAESTRSSEPEMVERLRLRHGPIAGAGRVFLRALGDAAPSDGLRYELELGLRPGARRTTCNSPTRLDVSGGPVALSATLAGAEDLGRPSCPANGECLFFESETKCALYAEAEAPDRLYVITPPAAPSVLRARVRNATGAGGSLSLALVGTCDDDSSSLVCNRAPLPRRPTQIERVLTTAADVFLLVSADGVASGYELELDVVPITVPANDTCASASVLAASGTQLADTFGATDDDRIVAGQSAICEGSGPGLGPERFFRIDLAARERAAIEVEGPRGGFLWAGRSCLQMTRTCTIASEISFGTPVARALLEPAQAGSFFLAVDGAEATDVGTFTLRAVREPELECLEDRDCTRPQRCDDYRCVAVPANDTCPGTPIDLNMPVVSLVGSTGAADSQHEPSCISGDAPDVVYSVLVPAGLSELAVRITDARFDPALAVRFEQCGVVPPDEACNDDVRYPDTLLPEVRIEQPTAGTYYVIVDAFAGEGTFTLELEATP